MKAFSKLLEPGQIGRLKVKNRMVMPPMTTRLVSKDGSVSEQIIDYYAERARGGVGLIMVEPGYCRPEGNPNRLNLGDDSFVPGLRRLVNVVHKAGAKIAMQIIVSRGRSDDVEAVSPSDIPNPITGVKPRPLMVEDIRKIVKQFGEGAKRAKKAGFDGVLIHGASGYLISEFLSPLINRRTDEYGGSLEGRARFALEVVQSAIRETGPGYPIMFRLSADEHLEGGFSLQEAIPFCLMLEKAGVNAVDIVSGGCERFEWVALPMPFPRGSNAYLAEAIKKAIRIPVMVTGRINEPYLAESILQDGKADFVCLGRALIADPEFPNKVMEGRVEDIRPCIACIECGRVGGTLGKDGKTEVIRCTVNPVLGREKELKMTPAKKVKDVLVVGGGPAGMEAARICAMRGHKVTLWERENELGGQLNLASIPPYKEELKGFGEYFRVQLKKLGVDVHLGREATSQSVIERAPDMAIIAEGSVPLLPEILGIEREMVVSIRDVLAGKVNVGKRVVVLGGGAVGCETAEFLVDRGKQVAIVEILEEMAGELVFLARKLLLDRVGSKGVTLLTQVKAEAVTDGGLRIVNKEGKRAMLEADNIVLATGSVPKRGLFEALQGKIPELYMVGDCVEPRRMLEAVREGMTIGLQI